VDNKVVGVAFDTTSSNNGMHKGACVLLEKLLKRNLLHIASGIIFMGFTGNSPRTIARAQLIVAQLIAHNPPRHNLSRTIHLEKIKIPLDEFLILLDFRYMSARFR
jgi:hypothetical protein